MALYDDNYIDSYINSTDKRAYLEYSMKLEKVKKIIDVKRKRKTVKSK